MTGKRNLSLRDRFEQHFMPEPNSGCWLWISGVNDDGYGRFRISKAKLELAHRLSYEIYCEPIPCGMQVLHRCDNPPCVNPDHLFLGTHTDNMRDMGAKGRKVIFKREKHGMAKLNASQVFEIRWRSHWGEHHRNIGADFGVTRSLVGQICRNEIWQQECHD